MSQIFDPIIDRRSSDSGKWNRYDEDVLPLWVADMDFATPEPVIRALRQRVEHGVFGYGVEPPTLRQVIVDRLLRLYGWQIDPEAIMFVPGVVVGFNLACRALTESGDGILAQTPVYYPILHAPKNNDCVLSAMELIQGADGRYSIDLEAFKEAARSSHLFILCNPHNPVGRVFSRQELVDMAEICLRHDVVICSDEIHCDLLLGDNRHVPIASLDQEIAQHTITLMAPSKTYNIAGLKCSVAIVENAELRERLTTARGGLVGSVNVMGYAAALAAYSECDDWLAQLLSYLEANVAFLAEYVSEQLPGIRMSIPEGTHLAWLDCRQANIPGNPHAFFLEKARVALNDGEVFGQGGEGFVRLNFACPRATLAQALERMRTALATLC